MVTAHIVLGFIPNTLVSFTLVSDYYWNLLAFLYLLLTLLLAPLYPISTACYHLVTGRIWRNLDIHRTACIGSIHSFGNSVKPRMTQMHHEPVIELSCDNIFIPFSRYPLRQIAADANNPKSTSGERSWALEIRKVFFIWVHWSNDFPDFEITLALCDAHMYKYVKMAWDSGWAK